MTRPSPKSDAPKPSLARRAARIGCGVLVGGVAVVAIVAAWLYSSARAVPEFYTQALATKLEPAQTKAAADAAEQHVLTARNEITRASDWELVLKADEINSWLATELPVKMPKALPRTIKEPRVVISDGMVRLGCRYEGDFHGVLSLVLEPSLTDQPNTLALRVESLSLGNLPLPQKTYLDEVSKAADKAKIPLRWSDEGGYPVAIVTLPPQSEHIEGRIVHLEKLEVREGELVLRGRAERAK